MLQEQQNMERAPLIAVLSLLCLFIQTVESSTYHVALPTMTPSVALTETALLRASVTTATATVLIPGCTPTADDNFIKLEGNCKDLFPSGVGISNKGIKVESTDDFSLHVLPVTSAGEKYGDGYLAIPDDHLGDEYYVVTYCTMGGSCQFSVVGTAADTSVSIDFPVEVNTVAACVNGQTVVSKGFTTPFTLQENEVLHFESEHDLSGAHVLASEKVAVFSGASGVPYGDDSVLIFEQMLPKVKWAKEYVVIPNELNDAGDIIKIVTMTDNTKIEITGYSPFVLKKPSKYGATVERRIDWHMYSRILASNPVQIVQVMSVNLYNDTNNVGGPPAMVILQSPNQWSDAGASLFCSEDTALPTNTLVFQAHKQGLALPFCTGPGVHTTTVQATDINVHVQNCTLASDAPLSASGLPFGLSAYCNYNSVSASAMLLSNKLDDDFEDCKPIIATPGDDMDNDCNGRIDEVSCSVDDLTQSFNSSQPETGNSEQLTMGTSLPGYIKFRTKSCGVAEVILWCSSDSETHAALQISKDGLSLHAGGVPAAEYTFSSDCDDYEDLWLKWTKADPDTDTQITAGHGTSMATVHATVDVPDICFDKLTFHSLAGDSEFVINAGKDCAKIKAGDEADNYGERFVIPVASGDTGDIYVTSAGATSSLTFASGGVATTSSPISVPADSTTKVAMADIGSVGSYLVMEASTEVSVYLHRTSASGQYATNLLPTDILGPAYHAAILNYTNTNGCTEYSIDRELMPMEGTMVVAEHGTGDFQDSTPFLEYKQVYPVMCGDESVAMVQVPPRETLGTSFYIPKVTTATAPLDDALITVVTTEDSTYIKILGDYDREDIVDIKGTKYHREFVTEEVFTIETNKPVLVYLELRLTDDSSHSIATVIPSVAQYKTQSIFPLDGTTLVGSYCVDNEGNDTSPTTPLTGTTARTELTFTEPSFCMVLWKKASAANSQIFAWSSDINLMDQNELCALQDGTGKDADDDCDGLTDEEVCDNDIVSGLVDIDIDGSVNEDCDHSDDAYGSYSVANSFQLSVDSTVVECGSPSDDSTTAAPGTIEDIPATPVPAWASPSGSIPTVPTEDVPTYEPIDTLANATATVSLTNTFGNSSDTNVTKVVRYCDCVCPCGWANPPNLTEVELKEKVEQIQEKLKIKKTALSAWIRSKTSAQDNRPSATAVGTAGVTFLVVTLASVVMLDCASLVRDLRLLKENLKQAFEM